MENTKDSLYLHRSFWAFIVDTCFLDEKFANTFTRRCIWDKCWYDLFWGRSDVHIALRHNTVRQFISCEIYIQEDDELLECALAHKKDIEAIVGCGLLFTHTKGANGLQGKASKIIIKQDVSDVMDSTLWEAYRLWFCNISYKLKKVCDLYLH